MYVAKHRSPVAILAKEEDLTRIGPLVVVTVSNNPTPTLN
jgi:hypothetical protein